MIDNTPFEPPYRAREDWAPKVLEAVSNIKRGDVNGSEIQISGDWNNPREGDVIATANGVVDVRNNWPATSQSIFSKFVSDINKCKKLAFIGASIGVGEGTNEERRTSSLRQFILKSLQQKHNTNNYGWISAKDTGYYVPDADVSGTWTRIQDYTAFGGGYMEATTSFRSATCKGTFRYVKLVYEGGGSNVELVGDAGKVHDVDLSQGTGLQVSDVYDMGALQFWNFRIVNTTDTPTRIYGWYFYETDPATDPRFEYSAYVRAGMKSADQPDSVIDNYTLDNNTTVITLLMYNDTDMDILEAKTQRMIDNCKTNGRMLMLLSTARVDTVDSKTPNDAVFRKLNSINDNTIYVNMYDLLSDDYDFADSPLNLHPTPNGHRCFAGAILGMLGLTLPLQSEMV